SKIVHEIDNCHISKSHECCCHGANSLPDRDRERCFMLCSFTNRLAHSAPLISISRILDRAKPKLRKQTKYRILDCYAFLYHLSVGDPEWLDVPVVGALDPATETKFTTEYIEDSFQTLCMWILKLKITSALKNKYMPDIL